MVNHLFSHLLFNIPESGKTKENWKPKNEDWGKFGALKKFYQQEFAGDDFEAGKFKSEGYVFIPK